MSGGARIIVCEVNGKFMRIVIIVVVVSNGSSIAANRVW